MNQEIVTLIQNHPLSAFILSTAFYLFMGLVISLVTIKVILIPTKWNIFGQSIRKPKPSDEEEAAFRSMIIATSRREKEQEDRFKRLDELQKKKEDEAKELLLIIPNEELAHQLRDASILSVEMANAIRDEALARMIDPSSSEIEEYLQSQHEKIPLEEATCRMQGESGEAEATESVDATDKDIRWYECKGNGSVLIHETNPGAISDSYIVPVNYVVHKLHQVPSQIVIPEAKVYRSNVATGIKDLPKIDLYNLKNTGMQSIDDFARRIADKWEGCLKHKRPAVLRVRMKTIAGQILAGLLADNGIPVEPKRKP